MLTLSLKSLKQSERQSRVTIIMYLHWHILLIVKAHNTSVEGDNTVMEGDNNIVNFLLKQNTSYLDRQYGYLQCRKLLGWSMSTLKIIYGHVILNNPIEDNLVQRGMIICYNTLRLVLKKYKYNMKKTTLFLCFYLNLFVSFVFFLCVYFLLTTLHYRPHLKFHIFIFPSNINLLKKCHTTFWKYQFWEFSNFRFFFNIILTGQNVERHLKKRIHN